MKLRTLLKIARCSYKKRYMKKLVLIFLTFQWYSNHGQAQTPLTADAGPDLVICSDVYTGIETHFIGGQPSAYGGVPPYTYSWSFKYKLDWEPDTMYASNFFNDTTLANPTVVWVETANNPNLPEFVLTVTDANGNADSDSVKLYMSHFYIWLLNYGVFIELGDTVVSRRSPDIEGGFPPVSYLWRPNHGLIDSIGKYLTASPDTSIHYYATITDSVGCVHQGQLDYFQVVVWPVGIEDGVPNTDIKVYPNPASAYIQIERQNVREEELFTLYDMLGKQVLIRNLNSENEIIDVSGLAKGNYTFIIGNSTGKIVLN